MNNKESKENIEENDPHLKAIVEGKSFYKDPDGKYVLTEAFLRERGSCCFSGCRHCPYDEDGKLK